MSGFLFFPFFIFSIIAALIIVKGFALYRAARRGEVAWFIVLLILQTMGILELIYLFLVTEERPCRNESHHHHGKTGCYAESETL